jgi:hypothetical protein
VSLCSNLGGFCDYVLEKDQFWRPYLLTWRKFNENVVSACFFKEVFQKSAWVLLGGVKTSLVSEKKGNISTSLGVIT